MTEQLKTIRTNNKLSKVAEYKIIIQKKSVAFIYTNSELSGRKSFKSSLKTK